MKARKVKAKITRTVTEIAIVILDSDGHIESVEEVCEELDFCDAVVESVHSVISTFS